VSEVFPRGEGVAEEWALRLERVETDEGEEPGLGCCAPD
jgi:hypothetical protein